MEVKIEGQVVHIRKLSNKIAFFDVEQTLLDGEPKDPVDSDQEPDVLPQRICVVLKTWNCGEDVMEQAVKTGQRIHVGDFVAFSGAFEDEKTFGAKSFEVLSYWASQNPNLVFEAKPPPDGNTDKRTKENGSKDKKLVCKYFVNTGQCPKSACKFSHHTEAGQREELVQEVKKRRAQAHEEALGGQEGISGANRRARVFAEWILTKYGRDYFEEGLILDIGGGRGDLSFELATRHGLDCAVVDPRPSKLRRWQASYQRKHPEARIPKHYQALFTPDFLEAQDIPLTSVKLIIGLHPDEATEPIVETALALHLPFAVIPCCVFAASFPLRRLKDGSSPSSYEEFLVYLKEKDAKIQEGRLSFLGKNTVLFKNS